MLSDSNAPLLGVLVQSSLAIGPSKEWNDRIYTASNNVELIEVHICYIEYKVKAKNDVFEFCNCSNFLLLHAGRTGRN